MTERITHVLYEPVQAHRFIVELWPAIKVNLMTGKRMILEVRPEKRSDAQNRRLWAMLTEISEQVDWHGNRLTPSEWKDLFTAALKRQKAVPGIDGGFVVLGAHTSTMTKAEMSDLQELMTAFAAEREVIFKDPTE